MKAVFKALICAMVFLSANMALASGKMTFKPQYDVEKKESKYALGLAVYEKVWDKVGYVSWTGLGLHEEDAKNWYQTEQGLETYWGPLAIGGGLKYKYTPATEKAEPSIYGTLSMSLW